MLELVTLQLKNVRNVADHATLNCIALMDGVNYCNQSVDLASMRRCSNSLLRLVLFVFIVTFVIFLSLAYPLLQRDNAQRNSPARSSLIKNWPKDAVALDPHNRRENENKLAGLLNETMFVAYAATDPNEVQVGKRIKMILDQPVDLDQARTRLTNTTEDWMFAILSPRYDSFWPRFRQLLQIWSRDKRHEPLAMKELMVTMKKNLDNFFNMQQANPQQRNVDHDGESERYRTCAVVGNSGILLNQSLGSFIDSHDAVIRLNNAKLRGFEESVGSKTTISFVNSNVYQDWSRQLNCFCHPYGNIPIVMYLCQVQHLMDIAFCEPRYSDTLVLVTDPRFDTLCTRLVKWYSVKNYVEVTGNPILRWALDHHALDFHYSSGLQAVVLALGICEKVDIFGFGKSSQAQHHYHSNERKAELSLHDYAAEYLFYDDLALNRSSSIPFLSEADIQVPPLTIYR